MKLTRRQEEFIKKMIELGQELDGPFHYTVVAEKIGVSPFTAYDMLRLLEEKGMVTSEYQLATDKTGPGRATRLFYPTEKAKEHHRSFAASSAEALSLEGDDLKQFLLQKLTSGELTHPDIGQEMLARIPPTNGNEQVSYCMEVMAVLVLRLKQSDGLDLLSTHLSKMLSDDGTMTQTNLCLLGGFAFGILAEHDSADHDWTDMLFEHVQQYVTIIMQLSAEECRIISEYITTTFTIPVEGLFPL